jgi:PmbA protein
MRESLLSPMKDRLLRGLDDARRQGAEGARLSFSHAVSTHCSFEAGRLKTAGAGETAGFTIEVLVGDRLGRTAGNRPDDLERLIGDAVALTKVGSQAHFRAYPAPQPPARVRTHSAAAAQMTRDDLLGPCAEIVERLRAFNPDLRLDAEGRIGEAESLLVTSGGVCHERRETSWRLDGNAQRTEGSDILFVGEGRRWRDRNALFTPQPIIDEMLADLRHAGRQAEAPRGPVPAVLPPEVLEMFLWPLTLGTNGRHVAKGDSPLAGRLGERILAPCFTIADDPHVDFSSGAREIDDAGIPTRRQALVRNGVLERFFYDLDSAGLAGVEPTGNAGCSPYWLTADPGARCSADLLASVPDGILIKQLIGFGQSNIINGDFSANVGLGYRVRNGEIVGRIKNAMVAGNVYELLAAPGVELSSDTDYRRQYPWARVPAITVSARAGQ